MNYCILLFLPTKPVFKNTPHPDCHVGGRGGDSEWQGEWDKGLPCVILSSLCGCTASIKEVQPSESSCLIVTTAFNNIFQDSDLENVGRINVIKMWFLLSSSCPFFPLCISLFSFWRGLAEGHTVSLTLCPWMSSFPCGKGLRLFSSVCGWVGSVQGKGTIRMPIQLYI